MNSAEYRKRVFDAQAIVTESLAALVRDLERAEELQADQLRQLREGDALITNLRRMIRALQGDRDDAIGRANRIEILLTECQSDRDTLRIDLQRTKAELATAWTCGYEKAKEGLKGAK